MGTDGLKERGMAKSAPGEEGAGITEPCRGKQQKDPGEALGGGPQGDQRRRGRHKVGQAGHGDRPIGEDTARGWTCHRRAAAQPG